MKHFLKLQNVKLFEYISPRKEYTFTELTILFKINSTTFRYTDQITMLRKLFSESSCNVIPKHDNIKFIKHL